MTATKSVATAALAAMTLATLASAAAAQGYYRHGPAPGYVVAESKWGHGTARGAVRPGKFGPQVQLPGGTWIDCVRSCSETLRRESLDFFESHGRNAVDTGPGYFSWSRRW